MRERAASQVPVLDWAQACMHLPQPSQREASKAIVEYAWPMLTSTGAT
jgi:hypothetical protein